MKYLTYSLVIALLLHSSSAIQLNSLSVQENSCPDAEGENTKKLKTVLKTIADEPKEAPAVVVGCGCGAKERGCGCSKGKAGAKEAGDKAKEQVEKAMEKMEEK